MALYLGIDTSNYTTSVAVVNDRGELIYDERMLLTVEQGKRGLRQSDALFLHTKNLPLLFSRITLNDKIAAVGVSTAPRRTEGSYMPVFLAGSCVATAISTTHSVPLLSFSHQEGHLRAGEINLTQDLPEEFYAVHLSGGTTEILSVKRASSRYFADIIGATEDISAGQLVDRTGVKLGLSFPCGKELEKLAQQADKTLPFKLHTNGCFCSFSGVEAQVMRAIDANEPAEIMARSVLFSIAETLSRCFHSVLCNYGNKPILLAGGVASNQLIRSALTSEFGSLLCFAQPHYATDNAVGIAYLTKECSI